MVLYLATLRAGYVFLPLNTAYQSAEIEYFIGNAEPAVVVCSGATSAGSARSPSAPARARVHADDDRTGSLLERAAHFGDEHTVAAKRRRPGRHPLHQRHHRAQQGRHAEHGNMLSNAVMLKDYWGWQRRRADPRAAHLPCARPVRGHPRRALNGSKMIWLAKFDPKP
jgi:malonyl-CoA/methylmalonyl-CoA synthetase